MVAQAIVNPRLTWWWSNDGGLVHTMTVASPKLSRQQRLETMRGFQSVIDRASELGHVLGDELERVKVTRSMTGNVVRCSCGWASNPKSRPFAAYREGFAHLGDVLGVEYSPRRRSSLKPINRAV